MNQTGPEHGDAELTNLEMLGLLASRIIHDVKNKLAVISGHAQFAEIAKQNPKAMGDAMAIIKRVSEESGKHIEALAKLRKALPGDAGECGLPEAYAILQELLLAKPGWTLHPATPPTLAPVAIQGRWLKFLLKSFLSTCQTATGRIEVDQASGQVPLGGADVTPPTPENPCLRIRIHCQNCGNPDVREDPAAQFRILSVFEMLRRLEGGLVQQASPDGKEEITILIPLAHRANQRP